MNLYLTLLFRALVLMHVLDPNRTDWEHAELASTFAKIALDNRPLYRDDETREKTLALLVSVAFRESSFRLDAVGDHGRSVCAMQILDGPKAMLSDAELCVGHAYDMMVESFRVCRSSPVEERLSLYARGRCDSVDGKKISRDRTFLARYAHRVAEPLLHELPSKPQQP